MKLLFMSSKVMKQKGRELFPEGFWGEKTLKVICSPLQPPEAADSRRDKQQVHCRDETESLYSYTNRMSFICVELCTHPPESPENTPALLWLAMRLCTSREGRS